VPMLPGQRANARQVPFQAGKSRPPLYLVRVRATPETPLSPKVIGKLYRQHRLSVTGLHAEEMRARAATGVSYGILIPYFKPGHYLSTLRYMILVSVHFIICRDWLSSTGGKDGRFAVAGLILDPRLKAGASHSPPHASAFRLGLRANPGAQNLRTHQPRTTYGKGRPEGDVSVGLPTPR
jgi:hypothetical protein